MALTEDDLLAGIERHKAMLEVVDADAPTHSLDTGYSVLALGHEGDALLLPPWHRNATTESVATMPSPWPASLPFFTSRLDPARSVPGHLPLAQQLLPLSFPDAVFDNVDAAPPVTAIETRLLPSLAAQARAALPHVVPVAGESQRIVDDDVNALLGWTEVLAMEQAGNAQTSSSLLRAPAPLSSFVRGSVNNLPFRPGGLDDELVSQGHDSSTSGIVLEEDLGDVDVHALYAFLTDETVLHRSLPGLPYGMMKDGSLDTGRDETQGTYRVGLNPQGLMDRYSYMPSDELDQVCVYVCMYVCVCWGGGGGVACLCVCH
jgi:hypothetical protein